jgi:hypothetical protein
MTDIFIVMGQSILGMESVGRNNNIIRVVEQCLELWNG